MARGRRPPERPRYRLELWNVYDLVINKMARTNNQSEGWHNRFRIVVGRDHPSLYTFLTELQKEQGDTETMRSQIALGQTIKSDFRPSKRIYEERIYNIVHSYDKHKQNDTRMEYLKLIGCDE